MAVSTAYHVPVVLLYDQNEAFLDAFSSEEFDEYLAGEFLLEGQAASVLRGCYCLVGNGLALRSCVFFLLPVDENGQADASFNVPLTYLAQHAGVGAQTDQGDVSIASRGQCPVPWHSLNLWDPQSDDFVIGVQKRIYRNQLGLPPVLAHGIELESAEDLLAEADQAEATAKDQKQPPSASGAVSAGRDQSAAEFAARLEATFGRDGKLSMQEMIRLHAEQLAEAKHKHRHLIEEQHAVHLSQMRDARKEIHELKVALRQEQSRNRRLQQMLRGDP